MKSNMPKSKKLRELALSCFKKPFAQFTKWNSRKKYRSQLALMPQYLLDDIGMTINERNIECRKHFWER